MPKCYFLTKQEIADAIVNYIGVFKEGSGFFPYRIINTNKPLHLPEKITFMLEYMPKGSKRMTHDI